ncbi:LysE family translocator [Shewanella intestini]|uniref:LysE family transporter n=1 Tax=Shewanella intestini TaxID=2017544 RepID=A0ABS5I4L6_9GAMM|nr:MULTISPECIES: LysE family transporter [Shewanella]MBR9728977.1 LysE family transporter [Shewanella intestini]MRG36957.1 LysE family translocator [Shewanella sp. XMDDZSB0408]
MDLALLFSLAIVHTIALMSPGPDFAIIVKIATQQHRSVALYTALGIAIAILCHTLLALLGVSMMIRQSAITYMLVQFVGISYLAWMGIQAFKSGVTQLAQSKAANIDITVQQTSIQLMTKLSGLKLGFLTNVLNPKALIFFITLFTVFVPVEVNGATKTAAAILLFSLSFIWFTFLAFALSQPKVQRYFASISNYIDILVGVIFVSASLIIALNNMRQF